MKIKFLFSLFLLLLIGYAYSSPRNCNPPTLYYGIFNIKCELKGIAGGQIIELCELPPNVPVFIPLYKDKFFLIDSYKLTIKDGKREYQWSDANGNNLELVVGKTMSGHFTYQGQRYSIQPIDEKDHLMFNLTKLMANVEKINGY